MSDSTFKASHSGENATERRTLRDYLIILRERVWIALPIGLLVAVALGYYQARATPLFLSEATMQIEKPEKIVTSQAVVDMSVTSEIDLNTYLQVLNSARLRTRVMESLSPDEVKILGRAYLSRLQSGKPPPSISDTLGTVSVRSIRNSFIVRIVTTHPDPEAAALVANRYVEQFMQYLLDSVGGKNDYAVERLRLSAEQLRKESEAADQRLQAYRREHKLVSLDSSVNIITDRLKKVNDALQGARLERLAIEELVNQVNEFKRDGRDTLQIAAIANHGSIPQLRNQLSELQRQQSVLSDRYYERHPKMIEIASAIKVAQSQLVTAIDLATADLQASMEKARANEKSLEAEYAIHEKDQMRLRDLAVDFQSLENQAAVAKNSYAQILDRLSQTTTGSKMEKIPVRPLDRAVPASAPFTPNISRIVRTCAGLGLLVFVGVSFGLSLIDDRIKSAWDVESFIGVSLLGIVPDLSRLKNEEKYSMVLKGDEAPGTEAFLGIYSSAKIHSKLDFPKAILVTSTIPGEGKTLVSCNLAASFARHGKKTLLVDCDLRRPMLHRHYQQNNNAGVIAWFEKGAPLGGEAASNPLLGITKLTDHLSLLCSGGRSKIPTEILEDPRFGQLIAQLKKEYDLVVVDSPPMGAVTDATLLAERTDEIVYVCRFNHASRKHIKLYTRILQNGRNEILGIVLNGMSTRRIEYYSNYRYYRSYKKYYGTQA
jgi:capsular exopolysaccharide synthesis family protein